MNFLFPLSPVLFLASRQVQKSSFRQKHWATSETQWQCQQWHRPLVRELGGECRELSRIVKIGIRFFGFRFCIFKH